jgi:hypothetical protein
MKSERRSAFAAAAVTVAVAGGVFTAACGQSLALTSEAGDAVEYDLVMFDTTSVPLELPFSGTLLSGRITLSLDGTCERALVVRDAGPASPGEVESSWDCEWEREGDEITFTWLAEPPGSEMSPAAATAGVIDGDLLTLSIDTGIVCVTTPCPTHWIEVYEAVAP